MSDKLLGGFLVRLANIVSEMKTTGTTTLHVTDKHTRDKLDDFINEVITAMEKDGGAA